jgi:hypothetical protein
MTTRPTPTNDRMSESNTPPWRCNSHALHHAYRTNSSILRRHRLRLQPPPFFLSETQGPTTSTSLSLTSSPQTNSRPSQTSSYAQTPSTSAPPNNFHTTYSVSDTHDPDNHNENDTFDRGGGKSYTRSERTHSGCMHWRMKYVPSKSLDEDTRYPC